MLGLGRAVVIDDWTSGTLHEDGRTQRISAPRGQQKGVPEELAAFVTSLRTGRPAVPPDVTWHVQHATLRAAASMDGGVPEAVLWPRPGA